MDASPLRGAREVEVGEREAGPPPRAVLFSRGRFFARNFRHHRRALLHLVAATAVTSAVITGALLVGDSVRGSLVERVLLRLGPIDGVLTGAGYFREGLARDVEQAAAASGARLSGTAAIELLGAASLVGTGTHASDVHVWGVPPTGAIQSPRGRQAALNHILAEALGARAGDSILLSFPRDSAIPAEHALGRRADTSRKLRLDVRVVLGPTDPGADFSLENGQQSVRNVFVPLDLLQRSLEKPGRANRVLLESLPEPSARSSILRSAWALEDAGLRLLVRSEKRRAILEAESLVIPPQVEEVGSQAARAAGFEPRSVMTYLANTIAAHGKEIPYSTVSAVSRLEGAVIEPGTVVLSRWAADDLGAGPGDEVRIRYYALESDQQLAEKEAAFRVARVLPPGGEADDSDWTPEYPGVSDARSLREWDPPFPVDSSRVRKKDEEYWRERRTTPKAFVALEDGRRLWSSRFGGATAIRLDPIGDTSLDAAAAALRAGLLRALDPAAAGLVLAPVKEEALEGARASTDFGGLFVGFSFFLIVASIVLAAMLWRLACERRSRELGTLSACGYGPSILTGLLFREGMVATLAGALVGTAGALGYAAALIYGLRTVWAEAINAPFLALHASASSLCIGLVSTIFIAAVTVVTVAAVMARASPVRLLAGGRGAPTLVRPHGFRAFWPLGLAATALALAVGAIVAGLTGGLEFEPSFFSAGAALLVASLAYFRHVLVRRRGGAGAGRLRGVAALGIRGAARSPGRSLLVVGVLASATFIIISVAAMRRDPESMEPRKSSGNGGFSLVGTTALPLLQSLSTPSGRSALGVSAEAARDLEHSEVFPFRVRPGDEASCLNLHRPRAPRILGATPQFIARGGFAWESSAAQNEAERGNPWLCLEQKLSDGAVPAIGDANSVRWILHSGLLEDIVTTDGLGRTLRLRIVGLLAHGLFQGELVVAEGRFLEAFPSTSGHPWFLFETPPEVDAVALGRALEKDLADSGFSARTTGEILAGYQAVENTYLSTFQVLGGLGLLLGTIGLGVALSRSVDERRGELALLRAVGYSQRDLAGLVFSETAFLLAAGLLAGAVSAVLAAAPAALHRQSTLPWGSLALTLGLIFLTGLTSILMALRAALRAPLIPSLRAE